MDIVTILRKLSQRRIYVAGVCVLAVLIGVAVAYQVPSFKSRRYETGLATAFILVDTPSSQVVDVSPRGSDTTAARASLLASLMIDGEIKSIIAQRAGLQPNQIAATTSAAVNPASGSGAATAAGAPTSGPGEFAYTTEVPTDASGNGLPIIQLGTQAPTPAGAVKLANAAIAGLGAYLSTKAVGEGIPDASRLQVTGMGAPQATLQTHGPAGTVVILAVIIVFLLGCAGILGVEALARGWRMAATRDEAKDVPWTALEAVPGAEEPFAGRIGAEEPFPRLVGITMRRSGKPGSERPKVSDGDWSPGEYPISTEKDSFRKTLRGER